MRAIFTRFDHFMAMFVALFGVVWSTMFMPLLGGPLHSYEAQAIGAGWQSLSTGQASNLTEAFAIATSLPAEAVFPSAGAEEPQNSVEIRSADTLELLGGPEDGLATFVLAQDAARPQRQSRLTPVSIVRGRDLSCDIKVVKRGACPTAGDPVAAGA